MSFVQTLSRGISWWVLTHGGVASDVHDDDGECDEMSQKQSDHTRSVQLPGEATTTELCRNRFVTKTTFGGQEILDFIAHTG